MIGGRAFLDQALVKKPKSPPVALKPGDEAILFSTRDPELRRPSFPGARAIFKTGGMWVFIADELTRMRITALSSPFTKVEILPANVEILTAPRPPAKKTARDDVDAFVEKLDHAAFKADLQALVDVQTRYTYSQGVVKALDFCEKTFKDLGYQTRRLPFGSSGKKVDNLEAVLPGFDASNAGEVIVVAHLDSTSPQASTLAPGADDNGSGAAGVLALARLCQGAKARATIRFVLVLGEEQGILGSAAYVKGLTPAELAKVRAVLVMDMIGFDCTPPLSVQIETNSSHRQMAEELSEYAARYTTLTSQMSFNPWGSDHVPFLKKDVPTVLIIETEYDDNFNYHKVTDLPKDMNFDLTTQIMRLMAASVAWSASVER